MEKSKVSTSVQCLWPQKHRINLISRHLRSLSGIHLKSSLKKFFPLTNENIKNLARNRRSNTFQPKQCNREKKCHPLENAPDEQSVHSANSAFESNANSNLTFLH